MKDVKALQDVLNLIHECSNDLKESQYLELCTALKNVYESLKEKKSKESLAFQTMDLETCFVCKRSLMSMDIFVHSVNMARQEDTKYLKYMQDLSEWEKRKDQIPSEYHGRCIMRYCEVKGLSMTQPFTIQALRDAGLEEELIEEEVYASTFSDLGETYMDIMKLHIHNAAMHWIELTHSEGFHDLIRIVQEGYRAIQWRLLWQKKQYLDTYAEVDGGDSKGHFIDLPLSFIFAEEEPRNETEQVSFIVP